MRAMNWGWSRLMLGVAILALALLGLGCKDVVEAPTSLAYATNPASYVAGVTITPNSPTASGGAIDSYGVSPTLPTGLSLDTKTGIISGTPSVATSTATYTVTGTNATGSTTASLSITVSGPSLTITSHPTNLSILVGQTALFSVSAAGTGTLSYQWLKGGVAIAGATAAAYTTPTAILADSGSSFTVQVSDAYGDTVTSNAAVLTVTAVAAGAGTSIATGSLAAARAFHTATLLDTGDVLITGGKNASSSLQTAELYDPTAGTFSAGGSLTTPRYNHTATLLADGRVLLIGGVSFATTLASAEIYDPATGTFTATGSLLIARASWHVAALLPTGKVLIAGGLGTGTPATLLSEAELFDPATGLFTSTGSLTTGREAPTATVLGSGKTLVVGGAGTGYLSSAELYY